jgi:hypothetical protein
MKQRLPKVFYNHVSLTGTVIAVFNAGFIVFLIERAGETGGGRRDRAVFQVMKYPHPTDIGDSWKEMLCHECHGAAQ